MVVVVKEAEELTEEVSSEDAMTIGAKRRGSLATMTTRILTMLTRTIKLISLKLEVPIRGDVTETTSMVHLAAITTETEAMVVT